MSIDAIIPSLPLAMADGLDLFFNVLCPCGLPVVLVLLGLTFGRLVESRHLVSIEQRRQALSGMLLTDNRRFELPDADPSAGAEIVFGECVIGSGYLKGLLASIKKIFGGELTSYHKLMTRARDEAQLRLLEEARVRGFDVVCNVRIEAVNMTMHNRGNNNPAVQATMLAIGTAYRRRPGS
jgi:uncharacterized protein YbjQ (UPF0145 family)